ncbi:hypothetical protein [Candidatus Rariloculus sp.]|uniref:hypothetical protein n=1 Tax=Candidatus Rariloculus sp. TaxID=3101265 RepID=UPI003D0D13EF
MSAMRISALSGLWLIVSACAGVASSGGSTAGQTTAAAVAPLAAADQSAEVAQVREVTAQPSTGSPDEVICRREVRTGSHFSVRVCQTRAQIEAARDETQEFIRERQRRSGAAASTGDTAL